MDRSGPPNEPLPRFSRRLARAIVVALALVFAAATAHAQDAGPDGEDAAAEPSFVPPRLTQRAQPAYPAGASGQRVDVELMITLDEQGHVTDAEVLGHIPNDAPEVFDRAARDAARSLVFEPARRDGVPIPVRLRFHMAIAPPVLEADAGVVADAGPTPLPESAEQGAGAEGITHAHTPSDAGVTATDAEASSAPPATEPEPQPTEQSVTVAGHPAPTSRGGSDFYTVIGALRQIPRANASDLLLIAPGILLTNEGGQGHAEQVYLRGFDAREGQDLEFTVNGIPFNEPGNPHGEGLANTHFIIPELVDSIRVLEGPFDPHQGNYAVAGSADYELGLAERGLTLQYTVGSFNTHRVLALWGPTDGRRGTFAGADFQTTDGFGSNRAGRFGRAMGQYELALGPTTVLRLLGTGYATQYGSAGLIREDDYEAGRIGFYGTYDPTQGGDESRYMLAATVEDSRPDEILRQQLFVSLRQMRLIENYTGFVQDPPEPWRSGEAQRGDAVDQSENATTIGGRGSIRMRTPWHGRPQSIEAGYFVRMDWVDSAQRRLRFGTNVPYRIDFDTTDSIANAGLYLDAEVRPFPWLIARGGLRADYFSYDVQDNCALHDTSLGAGLTAAVVDMLCYDRDRTGPRDPTTRRSASGLAFEPRASLLAGPFAHVTFTASAGTGARSADPTYIGQGTFLPFASIAAAEGGAIYHRAWDFGTLVFRAIYYYTHVGQDLIFNEQEGRNTLAPGTTRQGALAALRFSGGFYDVTASLTYADARFDQGAPDPTAMYVSPDYGNRVPYVPNWVFRVESALWGDLRHISILGSPVHGRAGVAFTYVSPRALPYNEFGEPLYLLDASMSARWRFVEFGVFGENLLGLKYRLAEYNYVSNFEPNNPTPSMVPARMFVAGAPLSMFATMTLHFGGTPGALP